MNKHHDIYTTMKIRYTTPYAVDGQLAKAYNDEMHLGGATHVCFVDRDTIWLQPKFGHYIQQIVEQHPDDYLTCLTNRTNCDWQRYDYIGDSPNDIERHVKIAEGLRLLNADDVEDHTDDQLWSGHVMVCPVRAWKDLRTEGLLGVDNEIHLNAQKQGRKVLLMTGVYVYHYYSNFDGVHGHKKRDKSHLV